MLLLCKVPGSATQSIFEPMLFNEDVRVISVPMQVVPHGSVASDAAACSRAGADALKGGGSAVDAAVAAALCLAVLAPHRTSLDASVPHHHYHHSPS